MINRETASFRDNKATVYSVSGKILRKVNYLKNIDFNEFLNSNFYKKNSKNIIKTFILDANQINKLSIPYEKNTIWLEHERLDEIIYPYELTFNQLKDSALLFLNLYIDAIENSYDIIDASAYNIQFKNNHPVFIDLGSFAKPKKDSEIIWHKQFCENYLAPLLIKSKTNINFNDIFKGNLNGIDLKLASKILPFSSFFNFNILTNIHLHSILNSKISSSTHKSKKIVKKNKLSLKQKVLIAKSLKNTIDNLKTQKSSYWSNYSKINSYSKEDYLKKEKCVSEFVKSEGAKNILDLGCNDGNFSNVCFNSGAKKIVGIDSDLDALDKAYLNFKIKNLNFSCLYQNFSNPSAGIGWNNKERLSFTERFEKKFDGVICLAFIHHICISNNVPLDMFVDYLGSFSNNFLMEFVSKDDEMVQNLLRNKDNLINNYNLEEFKKIILRKNYKIVSEYSLTSSRTLIHFKK